MVDAIKRETESQLGQRTLEQKVSCATFHMNCHYNIVLTRPLKSQTITQTISFFYGIKCLKCKKSQSC